ncbi:MAG: MBL fold metallo-hydrolase [Thiothrix sp.]|nr:MAG: MBL fold metallo-hydrolase [Thiothrix sp.]
MFRIINATVFVLLAVLVLSVSAQPKNPLDDYATQKVAANTYVISGPTEQPTAANQGFMNNPGFIVTKAGVVVVDPGSSYTIGKALLERIHEVTDKPVTHVFNSHVHGDHWLGNHAIFEAYPKVKIYAHPKMIEEAKAGTAQQWLDLLEKLTEGASKGTEAVIPSIALEDGQVVKVGEQDFRIYLSEWAHTKTDAMIEVVNEKLLFTGDNVTFKRIPRMDDGSFRGNIAAVEKMLELPFEVIVPGHGPTGGRNEVLTLYRNYLQTVYSEASALMEEGLEDFEMKDKIIAKLSAYQDWAGFEEEIGKHISLAVLEAEQAEFE